MPDFSWLPYLFTGIATLVSFLSYLNSRKVGKADAADKITDAATALIEPLKKRLDDLERENENLTIQLDHVRIALLAAQAQLKNALADNQRLQGELDAVKRENLILQKKVHDLEQREGCAPSN
jgi:chromosome segregation ATPase